MKAVHFNFLVVVALACPALAQTTNFIPKAPPRSYNAVVRLDQGSPNETIGGTHEEEHLFVPFMGAQPDSRDAPGAVAPAGVQRPGAVRVKRRPAQDDAEKTPATVSEIAAGGGRANDPAMREGGVVDSILKHRAASQRAVAKIRGEDARSTSDDEARAASSARDASFQAILNRDSLWHSPEDVAVILAGQRLRENSAMPPDATGRDSAGPFSRNARGPDFSAVPDASLLARPAEAARGAPLFGAAQAQNGSLFAPAAGGLYSRDEPVARPSAAPAPPVGFGSGDLKKPTTLPW